MIKQSKTKYDHQISKATGKILDKFDYFMALVPENFLFQVAISATELLGWGYGPLDVITGLSGIRDLAGGRVIPNEETKRKANLRGVLKIIGAIAPVPSYWVNLVLEKTMPIPGLDKKITK